jgi:hypothetical protein
VIESSHSCGTGATLLLKSGFWGSPTARATTALPRQVRVPAEWTEAFSMNPVVRIVLLVILALVSSGGTAPCQQPSASPPKTNPTPTTISPTPTAIPLAEVPSKAQSALDSLQETEANVTRAQSSADSIARTVSDLTSEIGARIAEDTRLLTTSASLEELYRLKRDWRTFDIRLLVLARDLTGHATSLEEQLGRLDKLSKTWQATLQLAKKPETPPLVLQRIQSVVDSVEHTRQVLESGQMHVLALQSSLSETKARVRTTLSSVEQAEIRAVQHIFVRDSPPIWVLASTLGTEWEKHSSESFSLQLEASAEFARRLPYSFLIHALFIALMATALYWLQRRIGKTAEQKPDLQGVLPILDVPVSTAFTLSILLVPLVYAQAPRLIHAIMGAVTLIPALVILRRLLLPNAYPILNAIVILYFVGQLQVLAAPLPVFARFIFLGQVLGASVFLVWVLRSWHPPTEAIETHGRVWRTIQAVARIGIILFAGGVPGKYFRIRQLGESFRDHFSQKRLHRGDALHRYSDHRRIDYYCPAGRTTWYVPGP